MPAYRLYFRSRAGRVVGREDIRAENAAEAVAIAHHLYDACSDVCDHFKLWDGVCLVQGFRLTAKAETAPELNQRAQQAVLDCEISIRDSQWLIADSKRLLGKIDEQAASLGGDSARVG